MPYLSYKETCSSILIQGQDHVSIPMIMKLRETIFFSKHNVIKVDVRIYVCAFVLVNLTHAYYNPINIWELFEAGY
jgi:hypothetical protein